MSRILRQSWFLVVLCALLGIGLTLGELLALWTELISKELVIGLVMLAVSLATDFRSLLTGRRHWLAIGLAVTLNAALAPPVGWLFAHLLPSQLGQGLVVAMSVPCTIASAIVWTRRGGGNDAAAAVVALATNFGCFVTLPFWTGLLLGERAGADLASLAVKLLACVAAPMLVGQLMRGSTAVARKVDTMKTGLSLLSQWGVLLLVLIGSVAAGKAMQDGTVQLNAGAWLGLLGVVLLLHLALLTIAWAVSKAASLPRAEQLTLLIAGTQKTMAVGLGVALDFGPLTLFPLVAYHFVQLVVDTLVVDRWRVH